jgi:hypothetical protein
MHKLRILSGLNAGAEVDLDTRSQLIGSDDRHCNIVIAGPDMPARACAVMCTAARVIQVQVFAAEAVLANDVPLACATHQLDLPIHLRIGGTDLLIGVDASPPSPAADSQAPAGVDAPDESAPGSAAHWSFYGAAALGCIAMASVFVWQISAASAPAARPRPATRPAVSQFGARDDTARAHSLGAGVTLVDAASSGTVATKAAAQESITLQLRAWQAGPGGYVETSNGLRYEVGSEMPGGYTLVSVDGDTITVRRGGRKMQVPLRQVSA